MAMNPQMMAMLASMAASYAGKKYGGGDDAAAKSQNKQSDIEAKAMADLYAMTQDGSLSTNPPVFSNVGGSNMNEVMAGIDFSQFRNTDLLKSIAGLIEGTGSFGSQQMQTNAASESALAEQLAPLIQELMKQASTKMSGMGGGGGSVSPGAGMIDSSNDPIYGGQ
jgi:hypothetical protein